MYYLLAWYVFYYLWCGSILVGGVLLSGYLSVCLVGMAAMSVGGYNIGS